MILFSLQDRGKKAENNTTLYVSNLPDGSKWPEVKALFEKYDVIYCRIQVNRFTKQPRNDAIVIVPKDQGEIAITELNETVFGDKTINVRYDRRPVKL